MINLVLMLLIAVAASGAAIYAGTSFFNTSQSVTDQQLTQGRLEETVSAIQANIMEIDGTFFVPAGVNGADYMQVPSWITPNARTTGNVPFLYCPYSAIQGAGIASSAVELPGSGSYAMQTYQGAYTSNHAYVVNSTAPSLAAPDGTLAVIVAPPAGGSAPADCTNLTLDANGHLLLNGAAGSVAVVTAGQFFNDRIYAAAKNLNIVVSPAGSGDRSGRDGNNTMTLTQVLQFWRAVKPRQLIVEITAGPYTADAATFPLVASSNMNAGNDRKQILFLTGDGAQTITISSDLTSFGADLVLNNVTFNMPGHDWDIDGGNRIALNNSVINLKDLNLHDGTFELQQAGSSINASGNVTINPDATFITNSSSINFSGNNSLYVSGEWFNMPGGLTISGPNGSVPIEIMAGGQGKLSGPLTFAASSGNLAAAMEIQNGGMVDQGSNAGMTIPYTTSYGIGVKGTLALGANVLFPDNGLIGIQLMEGGVLKSKYGQYYVLGYYGQSPVIGVYDMGGARVEGSFYLAVFAQIGGECWSGGITPNLFSRSYNADGSRSAPSNSAAGYDYLVIDNTSDWRCYKS